MKKSDKNKIMAGKVADSSTYLTHIHHRQTPMRIMYRQSDAGPVWHSEVWYQQMIHHPIKMAAIPDKENIPATYMAGVLKNAPHGETAKDFMKFLTGTIAKDIYKKYGFDVKEMFLCLFTELDKITL